MATRICRHCGAEYRGLVCPCRKRAWAEQRKQEQHDAEQAESPMQPIGLPSDSDTGEQPMRSPSTSERATG